MEAKWIQARDLRGGEVGEGSWPKEESWAEPGKAGQKPREESQAKLSQDKGMLSVV